MVNKSNANSLSYTQNLPPFLTALRSQLADRQNDGPDPVLASRRRATKPRSASEEAEYAPLVLDENGDVIRGVSVAINGEATINPKTPRVDEQQDKDTTLGGGMEQTNVEGRENDGKAGIGGRKKKRAGKAIGDGTKIPAERTSRLDETDNDELRKKGGQTDKPNKKIDAKESKLSKRKVDRSQDNLAKVERKRHQNIKLSFQDEEQGD
ncbi:hypothetical protein SPI_00017 [Niveomyces insectorum RCEF 264]|uniref:DUF4604 domain-containing protein n=1 Tax=Niveomyces insectorum RCEF 264 TaxID=1081102 RepID=A0A162JEN2_9HYPO|nr:hypothetical protein SPI_00017 [Niveomyces insectorum RCEF 264]